MSARCYWLSVNLRGNTRFPEAFLVQCLVEWDERRPVEELRQMAAEFYGVPLSRVERLAETPVSVARRKGSLPARHRTESEDA